MRAVALILVVVAACGVEEDTATQTSAMYGSGFGSGSGPPPDPCANQFPWTMCLASLNTWQKAPYVDSCWLGAPKFLPVHTTMEVVVDCYDHKPKVVGDHCEWDVDEWRLGRDENENHGTKTDAVCDHGPRIGEKLLIKTRSTGMLTDPLGGAELLHSVKCTCDGYNAFMGAQSLDPPSNLLNEVITALQNTTCDLSNKTPAELAAIAFSMLWYGNYGPLMQCAGNALASIRDRFHACNNDAAVEEAAFWRGGECPEDLAAYCRGPRWYY